MSNKLTKYILCILIISVLIFHNFKTASAENNLRVARIQSFSGVVKISKAGGEKTFTPVEGMSLVEGDGIITEKNSWIMLYIDDDKELKIDSNSIVNLSQLSGHISTKDDKTQINLWVGKVWSNIKKKLRVRSKYEIKVPTTVMGVKGTKFAVESNAENEIQVPVLSGKVSVTRSVSDNSSNSLKFNIMIPKNKEAYIPKNISKEKDINIKAVKADDLSLFVLNILKNKTDDNTTNVNKELLDKVDSALEKKKSNKNNSETEPMNAPIIILDPFIKSISNSIVPNIAHSNSNSNKHITNTNNSTNTSLPVQSQNNKILQSNELSDKISCLKNQLSKAKDSINKSNSNSSISKLVKNNLLLAISNAESILDTANASYDQINTVYIKLQQANELFEKYILSISDLLNGNSYLTN